MNKREVKEVLKWTMERSNCAMCRYKGQCNDDYVICDIANDIAIECIEKQIPRKPIKEQMEVSEEWQKLFDGIDVEVTCYQYRCPVCENTTLDKGFDYCPNCGMKLDWGDNE